MHSRPRDPADAAAQERAALSLRDVARLRSAHLPDGLHRVPRGRPFARSPAMRRTGGDRLRLADQQGRRRILFQSGRR